MEIAPGVVRVRGGGKAPDKIERYNQVIVEDLVVEIIVVEGIDVNVVISPPNNMSCLSSGSDPRP